MFASALLSTLAAALEGPILSLVVSGLELRGGVSIIALCVLLLSLRLPWIWRLSTSGHAPVFGGDLKDWILGSFAVDNAVWDRLWGSLVGALSAGLLLWDHLRWWVEQLVDRLPVPVLR